MTLKIAINLLRVTFVEHSMKSYLTVSRHWNNPEIQIHLDVNGISLKMSLEDLKEALIIELSPVSTLVTKKGLRERLNKAFNSIVSGIKEESAKVIK